MASNYEKPPVFTRDHAWAEGDLRNTERARFGRSHARNEAHAFGIERGAKFLAGTIPDYPAAAARLAHDGRDAAEQVRRVLEGAPGIAGKEVADDLPGIALPWQQRQSLKRKERHDDRKKRHGNGHLGAPALPSRGR